MRPRSGDSPSFSASIQRLHVCAGVLVSGWLDSAALRHGHSKELCLSVFEWRDRLC